MHPIEFTKNDLKNRIDAILEEEIIHNKGSYNFDTPYQTYERIDYIGRRWSVEKRIEEYGLDSLCQANSKILDIGSNFGFFTVELAIRCELAHGVEWNPYLNRIGRLTAEHLGLTDEAVFFNSTFDDFVSDIKYDLILSMASFYTEDGKERVSSNEYFRKVRGLLSSKGHLFYESTSYIPDTNDPFEDAMMAASESISKELRIVTQWESKTGSQGGHRKFIIASRN